MIRKLLLLTSILCFSVFTDIFAQAPINDNPCNAVGLTVNSDFNCGVITAGTTINATASAHPDDVSGAPNNDVWYSFVATSTQHRVQLRNIINQGGGTSTSTDMGIGVYDGTSGCSSLILEGSSDPETYDIGGLTIGTLYYVRVYGWYSSIQNNNFNICIGTPPPPQGNDDPCGAVSLTVNSDLSCTNTTSSTVVGATNSGINACLGTENNDVWFSFVATNTNHSINLLNITGSTTDMVHAVYGGFIDPDCSVAVGDNISCSDPNSSAIGGLTVGQTYFVQVYTYYTGSATTTFDICIGTPPPGPANDDPCGAVSLTVNPDYSCANTTSGTVASATNSGLNPCYGTANNDVWYSFVATNTSHTVDILNVSGFTDMYHAVYGGFITPDCSVDASDNIGCSDANSSSIGGLTVGQTYFVQVYTYSNGASTATFDICIGTPPPPPANDDPCGSIALTVNPNYSCASTTPGTIASATNSGVNVCGGTEDDDVWYHFVATGPSHTVDLINIAGSTTDLYHALYGPFTNANPPNCTNAAVAGSNISCSDPNSSTLTGLIAGRTYFVQAYSWTSTPGQTTTFDICIGTPPPPPSNDEPCEAISLTPNSICNYSFYTNASATASTGVTAPGCGSYSGGDVWFSVLVDSTGEMTIDTETAAITDSGMAAYSGTCGALTLIECDDDDSANGAMSQIILTGRTPGETIYIRFWEYGNDNQGTFGICATSPIPPDVYGVYLPCPGEPSEPLTSTIECQGALSIGNTINGNLNAATNNVALQPLIFISSADPCQFDATDTSNYTSVNFTVDATGTYVFAAETPIPYFDSMGYIYETASGFTPGTCSPGYIAGDDDDGPNLDPLITANLTVGVTYTLVTTKFAFGSTTHTGAFTWNVTGPPRGIDWYTTPTGGTPIGSGSTFDPVGVAGSPLADTNTAGLYSFWGACPSTPGVRFQADYIIGKMWNGSQSTDWYNANNWTPLGIPTSADCVVIPNITNSNNLSPIVLGLTPPIPPLPGLGKSLRVDNNGHLELLQYANLIIADGIDVANNGRIVLRSGSNLIQVTNTGITNSGTINMQRTVNNLLPQDYVYWSSPVDGFNITQVSPNSNLRYKWIPTISGNGAGNYGNWEATSEIMQSGKGYIVRGVSGALTFPTTPANTVEFRGTPRNGATQIPVSRGTYTGGPYTGAGNTQATALDDNWNLIGNPYPSAISADAFIAQNAGNMSSPIIAGTVYLWTHVSAPISATDPFYGNYVYNYNANDYIAYNGTGSNPPNFNGNIGAGQAFFVLMNDGASTPSNVEFNNSMRFDSALAPYDNNEFFRDGENTNRSPLEKHRIWIDLVASNNKANSILVGYIENATNYVDILFDGHELSETSNRFYSLVSSEEMAIQGRALPFVDSDLVPLGVKIATNGNYKIALNTLDGLFSETDQTIYIEDIYTNTIHNIRMSPYSFHSETGIFNDRFILRYTDNALSLDDFNANSGITISAPNSNYIKVSSKNSAIKSVYVYDMLGRQLIQKLNINSQEIVIDNMSFSEGTYIVKAITTNNITRIEKVVLKH
ncbi:T9SS type A sorting domain-containing protein [Bizionia myxarmorum]|uniref:T9SS type A sorting domain-containing protein n=1 Tax=Bizionia myxarmorum TaxID=291186 RepID=A0A5D0R3Z9_9FLAO|nr:T9SS type A sorting domain-containing protein [Bizionia myxarmorum]TYB75779.1 T9SS type A sorting domain-containing protein [Bizionia myxarmorum]